MVDSYEAYLDGKVKTAIESTFVGDVIFSSDEIKELIKQVRIARYHDKSWAQKAFVVITNLTKQDEALNNWREVIAEGLGIYTLHSAPAFSNYMDEIFSLVGRDVLILKGGNKFRTPFMCQSLSPASSIYSLANMCQSIIYYKELDTELPDDDDIYNLFAFDFKTKFNEDLNTDESLDIDGNYYEIKIGLKRLADEQNETFGQLIKRIVCYIYDLDHGKEINRDTSYLAKLISRWWDETGKNYASVTKRKRGPNSEKHVFRTKPIPRYFYEEGSLYIEIPGFALDLRSNPDLNWEDSITFVLCVPNLESGVNQLKEISSTVKLDIFLGGFVFNVMRNRISISELLDDYPDLLSCVIPVVKQNGAILFPKTESDITSMQRDLILFDADTKSPTLTEIHNENCSTGNYFLYTTNINNVLKHPDDFSRLSNNFYYFSAKDGEILQTNKTLVTFGQKLATEQPKFLASESAFIYNFNGSSYPITDEITFKISPNLDLKHFGIVIRNNHNSTVEPFIIRDLDRFEVKTFENYQLVTINLSAVLQDSFIKEPCSASLFQKFERSRNSLDAILFIYIPRFKIKYFNENYCFDSPILNLAYFENNIEKGRAVLEASNEEYKFNYLDGSISLLDPPVLKCSLNGDKFLTIPEMNTVYFFNEIEPSRPILFKPSYLQIGLSDSDGSGIPSDRFGEVIHGFSNDPQYDKKVIMISFRDLNDILITKPFITIFYRQKFNEAPITQIKKNGTYRLVWSPDFIGSPSSKFEVKISYLGESEQDSINFKNLTADQKVLDATDLHFGNIKYDVYLDQHPFPVMTRLYECKSFLFGDEETNKLINKTPFVRCFCTKYEGGRTSKEIEVYLMAQYSIGGSKKLRDGVDGESNEYLGHLYIRESNEWVQVKDLGGVDVRTIIWKFKSNEDGTLNKNVIELRYGYNKEEDQDFYDCEQFIVLSFAKRLCAIESVNSNTLGNIGSVVNEISVKDLDI